MNGDKTFTEEYLREFSGEYCHETNIHFRAFQTALETRRFEIDLYWKRATYFWAFIAVSFAGYFGVMSAKDIEHRHFFAFLIANFGGFLSFSFVCVNKGSKYWQENWENHVSLLGRGIVGPLFNIILQRPKISVKKKTSLIQSLMDRGAGFVTIPGALSVSKINQWISAYLLFVWVILMIVASPLAEYYSSACIRKSLMRGALYVGSATVTATLGYIMHTSSGTNFGTHETGREGIETLITE